MQWDERCNGMLVVCGFCARLVGESTAPSFIVLYTLILRQRADLCRQKPRAMHWASGQVKDLEKERFVFFFK